MEVTANINLLASLHIRDQIRLLLNYTMLPHLYRLRRHYATDERSFRFVLIQH
jgi:hypothetical protein